MAYTGTSIVDYLNSNKQASDFGSRATLAKNNGIANYTGTAEQNTQLLNTLNKPKTTTAPTSMGVQATSPYSTPAPTVKPLAPAMTLPNMASQTANSTAMTPKPMTTATPTMSAPARTPAPAISSPAPALSTPNPVNVFNQVPNAQSTPATPSASSYTGASIVDFLNQSGQPSDFNTRTQLASKYGIANYTGTAEQNTALLNAMRGGNSTVGTSIKDAVAQGLQNGALSPMGNGSSSTQSNGSQNMTSAPQTPQKDYSYTPPTTATPPQSGITQSGLIQQLLDKGNMTADEIANLKKSIATKIGDEYMAPGFESYQTGRAGIISNVGAQHAQALQDKLANERGLLGTAISATAPQMQFGQLTNPLTGAPVSGGAYGSNPQLQTAVQQAIQLVQNGVSPYDSSVQGLLSTFGLPGQSLFTQSMQALSNGTYNPQALGASSTARAGVAGDLTGQALSLDTGIKQLDVASSMATNFLNSVKEINPTDSSILNVPINQYLRDAKYSGAMSQYNAILGDIKKFTGQILATNSGSIPTDVADTLSSFDPSTLSASQLAPYLETLKQLGNNQLSVIQSQQKATGGSGYTGANANITTSSTPAPASTNVVGQVNDPLYQGVAGAGLGALGKITSFVSGLVSGGIAKSVLK